MIDRATIRTVIGIALAAFTFLSCSSGKDAYNLPPGEPRQLGSLEPVELAPGVNAVICGGPGFLVARLTLAPEAELPAAELEGERWMTVMNGAVDQFVDGTAIPMKSRGYERMTPVSGQRPRHDCIRLEQGVDSGLRAGKDGAVVIEVYVPGRADYLEAAGLGKARGGGDNPGMGDDAVEAGRVVDREDVQFADLAPGVMGRVLTGNGSQLAWVRVAPGEEYDNGATEHDRLLLVMRGGMDPRGEDGEGLERNELLYLPRGMGFSGTAASTGCDMFEVYPVARGDYSLAMERRLEAFHRLVPGNYEKELVVDGGVEGPGLLYCEGPSWIRGKLYFSTMHYDAAWNGDPARSALVEMDPDGTYRYILEGLETNGTFPLENGNMAVCDMFGHRVIEVTTDGDIVRTLADTCDGKRLDGPNDLAVADNGTIYFSDPQILPEPHMQPGRSIICARPDGSTARVVPPGVLEKPNGLILSPDCSILYVNSTPENFMMAYDILSDGTLDNGRKFGNILVSPEVLDQEAVNPQVDGMTVDELGNVYITSIMGLQIFSPSGDFVGMFTFPKMPVNCCFGDPDGRTLYVNCNDLVYRIRMKVRGAAYTLKGLD